MTKVTFSPAATTFNVARGFRGSDESASVSVDITALPESMIAALFEYGLRQKIADKASGAQTIEEAQAMLEQAVEQLTQGEWTSRASAGDIDPLAVWRRRAVRQLAKANKALGDKIKTYEAGSDRDAFLDHIAENNAEVVDALANQLRDADRSARAAAKSQSELTI